MDKALVSPQNKLIYINKPSITQLEIEYVNDAITNGWGDKCYDYIYKFEKSFSDYLQVKHSMTTGSCTGAIHVALMAMGIKAGDEVIVPDLTWIASVAPIKYIGATPVFVDVLKETWCIDPQKIEEAITPKTKAIIAVHLYGNMCEMDEIMTLAQKHNLLVLEDAAEALGSEYKNKKAGSLGDMAAFSFHGTKTFSTGEGGMLVTNNIKLYERSKVINDHGRDPKDPESKMFWMREYGYKYKMSNMQAAMGCAQINRAQELVNRKRQIFALYKELLKDVKGQINAEPSYVINSCWLPTFVFDKKIKFDREAFFKFMTERKINSRPFFYPITTLPMFDRKPENTVSYDIYDRAINLPSYHDLTDSEIKYVVESLKEFLAKNN